MSAEDSVSYTMVEGPVLTPGANCLSTPTLTFAAAVDVMGVATNSQPAGRISIIISASYPWWSGIHSF